MDIQKELFALRDRTYAAFQSKLTPTVAEELFIGVRVPEARRLARAISGHPASLIFMKELPHRYYDENMLHGLLISEMKEYGACVEAVDAFLPFVDNWAVCDIMSPRVFRNNRPDLLAKIREWSASKHTYTSRFGLGMLMSHFLDEDFCPAYLDIPASIPSDEYYVKMMIAWFFATALAKQWEAAVPYLVENRLTAWVHNKTIQKARESRRITAERKAYLNKLKRPML